MKNKKGVTTIWMAIGTASAAALTFVLIAFFVTHLLQTAAMGQTEYVVQDLVSIMETVDAAPGEVEMTYFPPLDSKGYPVIGSLIVQPELNRIGVSTNSQGEMWTLILNRMMSGWGFGALIRTVAELRSGFDIGGVARSNKAWIGGAGNYDIITGRDTNYVGGEKLGMAIGDKPGGHVLREAMVNDPDALGKFISGGVSAPGELSSGAKMTLAMSELGLDQELKELVLATDKLEVALATGTQAEVVDAKLILQGKQIKTQKLMDEAFDLRDFDKPQVDGVGRPKFDRIPLSEFSDSLEILRKNSDFLDRLIIEGGDGPMTTAFLDGGSRAALKKLTGELADPASLTNPQSAGAKMRRGFANFKSKLKFLENQKWAAMSQDAATTFTETVGKEQADAALSRVDDLAFNEKILFKEAKAPPKGFSKVVRKTAKGIGFAGKSGYVLTKYSYKTVKFVVAAPGYIISGAVKGTIWVAKRPFVGLKLLYNAAKGKMLNKATGKLTSELTDAALKETIGTATAKAATGAITETAGKKIGKSVARDTAFTISSVITHGAGDAAAGPTFGISKIIAVIKNRIEYIISIILDFFFTTLPLFMAIDGGHSASIDQYNTINWKTYAEPSNQIVLGPPNCVPDYAKANFDISTVLGFLPDNSNFPILLTPKSKSWGTIRFNDDGEIACMKLSESGAVYEHTSCTGASIKTASGMYEGEFKSEPLGSTEDFDALAKELFDDDITSIEDCACDDNTVHTNIDILRAESAGDECVDTPNYFIATDVGLGNAVEGWRGGTSVGSDTFNIPLWKLGEIKVPTAVPSLHEGLSWAVVTAPLVGCSILSTIPEEIFPGIALSLGCEVGFYGIMFIYYLSPQAELAAQPQEIFPVIGALTGLPLLGNIADIESVQKLGERFGKGVDYVAGDIRTTPYIINMFTGSNFLDSWKWEDPSYTLKDKEGKQYYMEFPYQIQVSRECSTGDTNGDGVPDGVYRESDCKLVVNKLA